MLDLHLGVSRFDHNGLPRTDERFQTGGATRPSRTVKTGTPVAVGLGCHQLGQPLGFLTRRFPCEPRRRHMAGLHSVSVADSHLGSRSRLTYDGAMDSSRATEAGSIGHSDVWFAWPMTTTHIDSPVHPPILGSLDGGTGSLDGVKSPALACARLGSRKA